MNQRITTALQPVPRTALFVRWLVLMLMAFDLLSAPLHAHAHDMGPDMFTGHVAAHADGGSDEVDSDHVSHAEGQAHPGVGHSIAALRSAEREGMSTPSLAFIVSIVTSLQPHATPPAISAAPWAAGVDHIAVPSRRSWRPEGRAPPVLHS
ncbi:MAG: hypothetical protein ACT6S0_03385 [Roseateles sp.]|uniref:hypothetical protein n=1 Tax=Roseateles sp. TaxID=1971397 RepID=UPI004036024B